MQVCTMPECQTTAGCQCDRQFRPNWTLSAADKMAVKLTIALGKHIPGWPGATDEQLAAVAEEILKPES
jgi:hypothetical protein